ncbi:uncharacterized protein LOC126071285 [Elephas maximus indicus]|uniref:uncharacterized protein LOC126071285 n=1 Tax=Elephas maximus indicus TaxID=99487 RepID=UPI002115F5C2|nr:uncharacterized protein LOC126071285 [Elephas maximus indicus]
MGQEECQTRDETPPLRSRPQPALEPEPPQETWNVGNIPNPWGGSVPLCRLGRGSPEGPRERWVPAGARPRPAKVRRARRGSGGGDGDGERQLGEQRKAERARDRDSRKDRQTAGEREGGGRRRSRRRTTRGAFPPSSRAPASLPPLEDRRPPKPLAWLGPTEPAAQHSDGSLPACLPTGLDLTAPPAEHVQRAPGAGQRSDCSRNHPRDTGGDRPFLLSWACLHSLPRCCPLPEAWAQAKAAPQHPQLTANDWQSPQAWRPPLFQRSPV